MVCETPLPFEEVAGKSLGNTSTIYMYIDKQYGGVCIWFSIYLYAHMYRDSVDCFWMLCSLSSKVNLKVLIIQQNFLPCLFFGCFFFSFST